jgi:hypothetical protein
MPGSVGEQCHRLISGPIFPDAFLGRPIPHSASRAPNSLQ